MYTAWDWIMFISRKFISTPMFKEKQLSAEEERKTMQNGAMLSSTLARAAYLRNGATQQRKRELGNAAKIQCI